MRNITTFAGTALLALTLQQNAQADFIVNTGTPKLTGASLVLSGSQWLAAEFTTTQTWGIQSIEGYIVDHGDTTQIGNTFTVSIYDNSAHNTPMLNSEEYYGDATFNGDGWNGLTGISGLYLTPGTYWVAFEVGSNNNFNDNLYAYMPMGTAHPLVTANYDGVSIGGYQLASMPGASYDFGVQITSVPEPSSLLLFSMGMFAVGRYGKRKAA